MSSLILRLRVKESDNYFLTKDVSGLFNSQNIGGYGVQTIRPEWIDTATIVVKHIRTGVVSNPINVRGNLGKNEGEFQITPWDVNSSWKVFIPGMYEFTYSITATTPTGVKKSAETVVYAVSIKQAECCVDKLTGKVMNIPFGSLFKDELSRKHAELSYLMRKVKEALKPECSNLDAADRMVHYISINCDCNC